MTLSREAYFQLIRKIRNAAPPEDGKSGKEYENLLYQIRPAFGGNIVATIVNPECRPQMATVREGVMKKEIFDENYKGEVVNLDAAKYVSEVAAAEIAGDIDDVA